MIGTYGLYKVAVNTDNIRFMPTTLSFNTDRDPHWYSSRVKATIYIRLTTTIDRLQITQRTAAGIDSNTNNAKDQNPPTMSEVQNAPVTRNLSRQSVNEVSATFYGPSCRDR